MPTHRQLFVSLLAAIALTQFASAPAVAATPAAHVDAKGGQDHPLIRRFAGSWLIGYKASEWDQAQFPTSMAISRDKWAAPITVEGKVTRLFYVSPVGKTPLEVYRNYEQVLNAAGFKKKFACESACSDLFYALHNAPDYGAGVAWAEGHIDGLGGGEYNLTSGGIDSQQGRLWYGTLPRNGREIHVLLYTSVARSDTTNAAATFLQIVEPEAMPTGQVTVDANALGQGLQADGKVAIYGLYFDTGKAMIKPESSPQLAEMAKLLQAQPALRVYVVGHTDNQGTPESNMTLSLQRAQAATAALATEYKIDAKRLTARGVGSLAPIANNASEDGRGRNRRVELVLP